MKASGRVSLPILTNSAEKTWRQCARLYRIQYVDLIRPLIEAEALTFGTAMHKALEAWWTAAASGPNGSEPCEPCKGYGKSLDGIECAVCYGCGFDARTGWLRAAMAALAADPDPYRRAVLEALMLGYHERWKAMRWVGAPYDGAPIEVVAVEQEFTGPLVNPDTGARSRTMQRGGKIDVLVRVAGDVWVIEHKTTSEDFAPGSDYRRRLRLDTQVSGYHVGARLLGHHEVKGVLYDVIGKPSIRPKRATPPEQRKYTKGGALYATQRATDESPDEFQARVLEWIAGGSAYARFEVVRLRSEEEDAARDTWQRAEEIRDAARRGRYPRNPSSCGMYGRSCAYLPICEGTATAGDGTRYRKAETAHEELSSGAEELKAA